MKEILLVLNEPVGMSVWRFNLFLLSFGLLILFLTLWAVQLPSSSVIYPSSRLLIFAIVAFFGTIFSIIQIQIARKKPKETA